MDPRADRGVPEFDPRPPAVCRLPPHRAARLRRGEACGLRWCDIDLDAATAVIAWQLQQYGGHVTLCPPKMARSERVIALDRTTVAPLRAHRAGQQAEQDRLGGSYRDSGYVLTNCNQNCNQEWIKTRGLTVKSQVRRRGAPGARTQNPRIKSPLLYH
jgi:integrase